MPELIAKPPLGLAPLTLGQATLAEVILPRITSVAPLNGQHDAVAQALSAMGLGFPAPNTTLSAPQAEIVWTGRHQAFLIGPDPAPLQGAAALTDQSDGWAALSLTGAAAPDILARLVPIDCAAMRSGQAARTQLQHMHMILTRDAEGFRLMVFRSMARTAWHELHAAMQSLAARASLTH